MRNHFSIPAPNAFELHFTTTAYVGSEADLSRTIYFNRKSSATMDNTPVVVRIDMPAWFVSLQVVVVGFDRIAWRVLALNADGEFKPYYKWRTPTEGQAASNDVLIEAMWRQYVNASA